MATTITRAAVNDKLQLIRQKTAKIAATVHDYSALAVGQVDSIPLPTMAAATSEAVPNGTCFTNQVASYGADTILLNKNLGGSFELEGSVEMQNFQDSKANLIAGIMARMGVQVDEFIYAALIAELQSAGENVPKTSDVLVDILNIRAKLTANDVPDDGKRYIALNAADEIAILSNEALTRSFQSTPEALVSGIIGQRFGMNFLSTGVVTGDSVAYHYEAVGYAYQGSLEITSAAKPRCRAEETSVWEKFGLVVTQSGKFAVRWGANPA